VLQIHLKSVHAITVCELSVSEYNYLITVVITSNFWKCTGGCLYKTVVYK